MREPVTALDWEERVYAIVALQYMGAVKILAEAGLPVKQLVPLDMPPDEYLVAADIITTCLGCAPEDGDGGKEEDGYEDELMPVSFPCPHEAAEAVIEAAADYIGYALLDAAHEPGRVTLAFYPGNLDSPDLRDVARFVLAVREILGKGVAGNGSGPEDQA